MESECKGCRTYKNEHIDSQFLVNGETNENEHCILNIPSRISKIQCCPCITCLVKTMCTSTCKDLQDYIKLTNYREEIKIHGK